MEAPGRTTAKNKKLKMEVMVTILNCGKC